MRAVKVSSRRKGEAIDVECIRKKSGVEHLFHHLPRDDSLSLRSVSPPLGPVSGLFYVIREVVPVPKLCHIRSFLLARLWYKHHSEYTESSSLIIPDTIGVLHS